MSFYRNLRIGYKLFLGFFVVLVLFNLTVAAYISVIEQLAKHSVAQSNLIHAVAKQIPSTTPNYESLKQQLTSLDALTVRSPFGEIALSDEDFIFRVVSRINWLISIAIILSIAAQWAISRTVTKPIVELQQAAEDVANGNFVREITVQSSDEVGKLATAFNTMTQNIRNLLSDVSEESARAQAAEQEAHVVSEEIEAQREYLATSVRSLLAEMTRLANGDLTASVHVGSEDNDIAKLCAGFNHTVETMREMIMSVSEAVNTAAQASDSILSGAEQMTKGIREQSAQTAGVATAMEEMTATIGENTRHASVAAHEASRTSDEAERSRTIMQEATNGMNRIADTVIASAATIQELGRSSEEIGEIVGVIEEIADQTNLLALNAAIEAARAGDQGRGFAVVADEVRKLAERTQQATKQITATIKNIQHDTANAVQTMNEGTREVERGKESVARTAEALQRMIAQTSAVSDIISQLATASEEQASTGDEIARNIDAINIVAGESAQVTQNIGSISVELHNRMEALQQTIGRFNIGQNTREYAPSAPKALGRMSPKALTNGTRATARMM